MSVRAWRTRCRKCRGRKTFTAKLEPLDKRCPCGGLYVIDTYRNSKRESKAVNCRCLGHPWSMKYNGPHRQGSPKCFYQTKRIEALDAAADKIGKPIPTPSEFP